jgi:hypothetical protein
VPLQPGRQQSPAFFQLAVDVFHPAHGRGPARGFVQSWP